MTPGLTATRTPAQGLWPWSVFAALIAAAGLPIYIHAPKMYAESYGIGLATLGAVLGALRLLDVVQDPFLGWLAEAGRARRRVLVAVALALLGASMVGLMAVTPPMPALIWFGLMMAVVSLAYSFLTIVFYAQGVEWAKAAGDGHLRLAGWREAGTLVGVSAAAVAPALVPGGNASFAWAFAATAVLAGLAMRRQWRSTGPVAAVVPSGLALFRPALADRSARWLLILALINSAPVAVTSTLFLFFVEDRLALPTLAGPYLLAFFMAAAVSAPVWSLMARRLGPRRSLALGMVLAIVTFLWAVTLQPGAALAFGLICLASGAALGGDLVLLPALFAQRLGVIGSEAAGFSLWAFVSKLALALSAATVLPLLALAGFVPGAVNAPDALMSLSYAYAALPCLLKAVALLILWLSPVGKD